MRLNACDALTRLTSEGPVSERARLCRTWCEPGGSADPSISDSVRLELDTMICWLGRHITPGLSDNVYLQNYACGDLNGRYRKFTVNYAPTK